MLEAAVQLLPHVSAPVVAAFLREINERLPNGIEPHVSRWITTMTTASASAIFGGPSAVAIGVICADLVNDGTISSSRAVADLLPAWRTLLVDATAPPILLPAPAITASDKSAQLRGIETITTIFSKLIAGEPSAASPASPAALLQRQRTDSRRMRLYTPGSLPDIGRCIALLAIQQELWLTRGNVDKAHAAGTLVLQVSSGSAFKMAVARDPQALATSMLDSPFITGIPAAPFNRPKVLAALLLALKDGSTGSCSVQPLSTT